MKLENRSNNLTVIFGDANTGNAKLLELQSTIAMTILLPVTSPITAPIIII